MSKSKFKPLNFTHDSRFGVLFCLDILQYGNFSFLEITSRARGQSRTGRSKIVPMADEAAQKDTGILVTVTWCESIKEC